MLSEESNPNVGKVIGGKVFTAMLGQTSDYRGIAKGTAERLEENTKFKVLVTQSDGILDNLPLYFPNFLYQSYIISL